MTHALATNLGVGYFNTTAVTNDTLIADRFELSAVALPLFGCAEYLFTEQTIPLGAKRSVVYGLGLLHFTIRPILDLLW